MKAKLKLLEYLDTHLVYGSIDVINYLVFGNSFLYVNLYPFKSFSNPDKLIIRDVLESEFIREDKHFSLEYVREEESHISAVYKFS